MKTKSKNESLRYFHKNYSATLGEDDFSIKALDVIKDIYYEYIEISL